MNIMLTLNSAFVKPAIVLIESLSANHPGQNLVLYIIHHDLHSRDQALLSDFCASRDINVQIIRQDISVFAGFRRSDSFPYEVYLRILAHQYTPDRVDRVLYLDTDVICDGNLCQLYNMDFKGNYLIACTREERYCSDPDAFRGQWNFTEATRGKYFNSGVLLINCQKLRADKIDLSVYREAISTMPKNYLFDQGLLNAMFSKKTLLIPAQVYNYRYGLLYLEHHGNTEEIPRLSPKLIHYAGEICPYKPWDFLLDDQELATYSVGKIKLEGAPNFIINRDINELAKVWWHYAKGTPVYDELYREMLVKKEWLKRGILGYLKRLIAVADQSYDPKV